MSETADIPHAAATPASHDTRDAVRCPLCEYDLRGLTAGMVMHRSPRTIRADALAAAAADMMEEHRITSVVVVDADGRLVGALTIGDLMRAKVV